MNKLFFVCVSLILSARGFAAPSLGGHTDATRAAITSPAREAKAAMGIDDTGWRVVAETSNVITWTTPENVPVSLTVQNAKPASFPDPTNAVGAQQYYRAEASTRKSGIVEVTSFPVSGVLCNLVTTKFCQADDFPELSAFGNGYLITAIIPTSKATYLLHVAGVEGNITGAREAVAYFVASSKGDSEREGISDRRDPYDSRYDQGAFYAPSDARKWDEVSPDHPLTRCRRTIDNVIKGLHLSDDLQRDALFKTTANGWQAQ